MIKIKLTNTNSKLAKRWLEKYYKGLNKLKKGSEGGG